jgi:hypothetical protein
MALYQLLMDFNKESHLYENIINESHDFSFDLVQNKKMFTCHILRHGDNCQFDYLLFIPSIDLTINDFINGIYNGQMTVTIGGSDFGTYCLSLFINLNNIIKNENGFIVKIPPQFTTNKLILIALLYHDVCIIIKNISINFFEEIKIYTTFFHYNKNKRNMLASNPHEILFPNLQTCNLVCSDITNNVIIDLHPFGLLSKGYFLETDVDHLDRIVLQLNNIDFIDYDKMMINLFCKKYGKKLLYIPFNSEETFENIDQNSFIGSINHSHIVQKISLYFDEINRYKVKVHSIYQAIQLHMNGLTGLKCSIDHNTVYDDYIDYEKTFFNEPKAKHAIDLSFLKKENNWIEFFCDERKEIYTHDFDDFHIVNL